MKGGVFSLAFSVGSFQRGHLVVKVVVFFGIVDLFLGLSNIF